MTKTAEIYLFVFILLVLIFAVLLALKHPGTFQKLGGQEAVVTQPHPAVPQPHPAAPPKKKHHLIKTVAKTGLMVAPLALLAM